MKLENSAYYVNIVDEMRWTMFSVRFIISARVVSRIIDRKTCKAVRIMLESGV